MDFNSADNVFEITAGEDAFLDVGLTSTDGSLPTNLVGVTCEVRKSENYPAVITKTLSAGIAIVGTGVNLVNLLVSITQYDTALLDLRSTYYFRVVATTTTQKNVVFVGSLQIYAPIVS